MPRNAPAAPTAPDPSSSDSSSSEEDGITSKTKRYVKRRTAEIGSLEAPKRALYYKAS